MLPNDGDTVAVAEAAAALARSEGIRVSVLTTRAQVQGLAAAAVHEPGRDAADDVLRMSAAAARCPARRRHAGHRGGLHQRRAGAVPATRSAPSTATSPWSGTTWRGSPSR